MRKNRKKKEKREDFVTGDLFHRGIVIKVNSGADEIR